MTKMERLKELAHKLRHDEWTLENALEQDKLLRSLSPTEMEEFCVWVKEELE
jgi:hypothetical protein